MISVKKLNKIGIIGIGYVGLPLSIELSRHFKIVSYDKNTKRIKQLKNNIDKNKEFSKKILKKTKINFTSSSKDLNDCQGYIVTVPTPLKRNYEPDLKYLKSATTLIGPKIKKDKFVIYESTVYPGCTNEFCLPILEKLSKLKSRNDLNSNGEFYVGYSPERINPGDNINKLSKINKVVGSDDKDFTIFLKNFYKLITSGNIFTTTNLKTAEAAKIIENTQRDLNIGLMNELSYIFEKLNIDTFEVIKAASTKWNFNYYEPGLVGGHCIGIDPYYLTYKSKEIGHDPKLILAARSINNSIENRIVNKINQHRKLNDISIKKIKILIFGISFKENCSDIRNSLSLKIFDRINKKYPNVFVYDPICQKEDLNNSKIKRKFLKKSKLFKNKYDICMLSVPHDEIIKDFEKVAKNNITKKVLIIDIKNKLKKNNFLNYFSL